MFFTIAVVETTLVHQQEFKMFKETRFKNAAPYSGAQTPQHRVIKILYLFITTDFQHRHQNLLKFHLHFQLKREEKPFCQSEHAEELFLLSGTYLIFPSSRKQVSVFCSQHPVSAPRADITGAEREPDLILRNRRLPPHSSSGDESAPPGTCVVALVTS